jgi:hypothetical protein
LQGKFLFCARSRRRWPRTQESCQPGSWWEKPRYYLNNSRRRFVRPRGTHDASTSFRNSVSARISSNPSWVATTSPHSLCQGDEDTKHHYKPDQISHGGISYFSCSTPDLGQGKQSGIGREYGQHDRRALQVSPKRMRSEQRLKVFVRHEKSEYLEAKPDVHELAQNVNDRCGFQIPAPYCFGHARRLQLEQFAHAFDLRAAHRNFRLLLIVHFQHVAGLEPRHHFLDVVNVHQIRAVRPPERFGIQRGV